MYGHHGSGSQDQDALTSKSSTGAAFNASGSGASSTASHMPSIEDSFDADDNDNDNNEGSVDRFDFDASAMWDNPQLFFDLPSISEHEELFKMDPQHQPQLGSQSASFKSIPIGQDGKVRTPLPPPPHRNACAVCRKRKLKCDGAVPECGRCKRLGHECAYVESRRKSGPKRGYVKGLESRLAQVEGLLKEKEAEVEAIAGASSSTTGVNSPPNLGSTASGLPRSGAYTQPQGSEDAYLRNNIFLPDLTASLNFVDPSQNDMFISDPNFGAGNEASGSQWALAELGVQEPLPPQETMDELTQLYFSKIHPSNDVIHQARFLATLSLSSFARPSIALRYAMWTLAAGISPTHKHLAPLFYLRTRKYAEADEAGSRTQYVNIRHAQAWVLIGTYEYKMLMYPKSWLSIGKAVRLCQMLGLHRLDGRGLGHIQALEKPGDVAEKEERRRTFWMAFAMDRYAAASTGWPVIVDERDILTFLPSSESAFENGYEEPGIFLQDAMQPQHARSLSSFGGVIVVASLTGRVFEHLSRPNPLDNDSDPNSDYWRSHRKIENILLNMVLHLPTHLRLPAGSSSSNTIFLNMTLQSATICLHQAAIAKAEKVGQVGVVEESRARCVTAANEIASIMKRIAHFDLSSLHPYIPFPLYLSTRIFAQMAKANPQDDSANSLVRFLLSALLAMKEVNPLVESYLAQLDMEDLGLEALRENVTMGGLETGVQGISLSESEEAKPWISYVSPMVRIVEIEEDSMSPTSASSRIRQASTPSTTDLNPNSIPSPNASASPNANHTSNFNHYSTSTSNSNTNLGFNNTNEVGQSPAAAASSISSSISPVPVPVSVSGSGGQRTNLYSHQNTNLAEHEMNFDIPANATDGFDGMETINMGSFPGPEAWDLEGEGVRVDMYFDGRAGGGNGFGGTGGGGG